MDYIEIKKKLETSKMALVKKMERSDLSKEEKELLQNTINNVDYILELTDMNHFQRGQRYH
jgi:hypothetical protein